MAPTLRTHCMCLLGVSALLGCLLLPARSSCADEAEDQVRLLADPEQDTYDAALETWEQREPAERVAILRRALVSEDADLAALAAEALGADLLDVGELRRQMALLVARPLSTFQEPTERRAWGQGGDVRPWGGPDVVPFFQHVVADRSGAFEDVALDSWHRVLQPRHALGLVPLLDQGGPKVFRAVLWHVAMCGEFDREDVHRAEIARGLLHGLERLRAERAGAPVPPLGATAVDILGPPEGGLPAAYVELAAAYYPRGDSWEIRLDAEGPPGDLQIRSAYFWLRRWADDLTPSAKDLPYLRDLVENAGMGDTRLLRWAVGHMADMEEGGGLAQVRSWASGAGATAAYAAAALAGRGDPRRFLQLLEEAADAADAADGDEAPTQRHLLETLQWVVDRPRAREAWVARVLEAGPPDDDDGLGLDARARLDKERFEGIVITPDDMALVAQALWSRGAGTTTLAWFHGTVWPEGLTAERAGALLQRLFDAPAGSWDERDPGALLRLLAHLEVHDAPRVTALLGHWLRTQPGLRTEVLQALTRLGDTAHAVAIVQDAITWEPFDVWVLGRVRCEAVRAFLHERAAGDDPEAVVPAVSALLLSAGLPERIARDLVWHWGEDLDEASLADVRRLLRAGDEAGAVWRAAQTAGTHRLGALSDPRARVLLERRRAERQEGHHLEATLGLAILGDEAATAELRSFLEDDRLWMIESIDDDAWSLLPATWNVEHWLDRLDSNCCLGWRAMVALRSSYPTLPFDDGYGGAGMRRTRAWIHTQVFRPSRLLDGLVPAAP